MKAVFEWLMWGAVLVLLGYVVGYYGAMLVAKLMSGPEPKRRTIMEQTLDVRLGRPEDEVDWVKFEADVERRLKGEPTEWKGDYARLISGWNVQREIPSPRVPDEMVRSHWDNVAKRRADQLLAPDWNTPRGYWSPDEVRAREQMRMLDAMQTEIEDA